MLTRLLLLSAIAVVEAAPLGLIAGLAIAWGASGPGPASGLPTLSIVAAILLAFGLTRVLMRRRASQRTGRVLLALGALAVAPALSMAARLGDVERLGVREVGLVSIPALAVLLYAWARGIMLAREDLLFDAVYGSFRQGLIILFVGLVLLVNATGRPAQQLLQGGWGRVLVFFLAALCALSLARVEEERRRGAGPEGPPPMRGEWLVTLLGVTIGVGLAGLALASLVSPAAAALTLAPLNVLADLATWLLTPVFFLLGVLLDPLVALLRSLLTRRQAQQQKGPPHGKPPSSLFAHITPHQMMAAWHALLIVVGLIVACVALWYAFYYRARRNVEREADEVRESLWSWTLLLAGLRSALRRLRSRLLGRRDVPTAPAVMGAVDADSALSIRAIYRRLLVRAAALGLGRRHDETPHEYLTRLRGAMPRAEKDAALLTGLYAHARYGPDAPGQDDVASAAAVWERLEPSLHRDDTEG